MNEEVLKNYLKDLGAKELEIRQVLTNPSSTVAHRTSGLRLLNDIQIFLRGFFSSLRITTDAKTASYYKEYYEQARSKKGLNI